MWNMCSTDCIDTHTGGKPMRSSGLTSIGLPAAIHRDAALHDYESLRRERPPPELRDANPGGMQACVHGAGTVAAIGSGA